MSLEQDSERTPEPVEPEVPAPSLEALDGADASEKCVIQLNAFEGPLDLLLHLIRKDEVDIYDIPISTVTEQYMKYLSFMRELNVSVASEFLIMASTLVYIKSKMLLPVPEEETEETADDPRMDLVERLLEYQRMREAAHELQEREQFLRKVLFRPPAALASLYDKKAVPEEEVPLEVSLFDLISAFRDVVEAFDRRRVEVVEDPYTVEDAIDRIRERLKEPPFGFLQIFEVARCREELIAAFLALLELVRSREARIYQDRPYEEIRVIPVEPEPTEAAAAEGPTAS